MAAVSVQRLSFDHDLRHCYTPISLRLQSGAKSLDGVLDILQMRIDAEVVFTNSLQKIIGCSTNLISHINPNETLRADGLDALYSDLKNEYTQRMAYLNSLKEDVQKPLNEMKQFYYQQNKSFVNQTKNNIKALKQQQNEFIKLKAKYEKIMNDKNKNRKQQLLIVKKKFTLQQTIWTKQQQIFDNKMTSTLQSMESNEYKRMNSLRDGLTNWSAFITNLCANRSYDIRSLNQSMSLIDVENDLQSFMTETLKKYPSPHQQFTKTNKNKINKNNLYFIPNLKKQQTSDYIQTYFKQKFIKQSSNETLTMSPSLPVAPDMVSMASNAMNS